MIARTVHLVSDGLDLYLGFVTEDGKEYKTVELNINQVVLIMKQCAEIISRCSIVRPVP